MSPAIVDPTASEMTLFAHTVLRMGGEGTLMVMQAAACLILSRQRQAAFFQSAHGVPHHDFGDGSLSEACRSLECCRKERPKSEKARFHDPHFRRAFSTACLALNGDFVDPTGGATHFHHHLDDPPWAALHQPTALIGDYFFYKNVAEPYPPRAYSNPLAQAQTPGHIPLRD